MFNQGLLLGNLTKDIELRYLQNGTAVAKTAVATSEKYKDATGTQQEKVCFMDITFWGRQAEIANQYLRKGSKVFILGSIEFDQWTAQDGSARSRHSIKVDTFKMLDGKPVAAQDMATAATPADMTPNAAAIAAAAAAAAAVAPAVAPVNAATATALDLNDPAVLAAIAAMTQQNANVAVTPTVAPTVAPAAKKPAYPNTPVIDIDEDEIPF